MNTEDLREFATEIVDFICKHHEIVDHCDFSSKVQTGLLKNLIPETPPKKGEELKKICEDFVANIMPVFYQNDTKINCLHGFKSSSLLTITKILSLSEAIGFSMAPRLVSVELETIVLNWYAKALNLPTNFLNAGTLQSSASECVLICLLAARAQIIESLKGDSSGTHDSIYLPQLTAYASKESHASIKRAVEISLVKLRIIETDELGRMRTNKLSEAISNDVQAGLTPFFVVAMVGKTDYIGFDDLLTIGSICKSYKNIWFHIDGSFAGNIFLLPEMQMLTTGLDYVDSFNTDLKKLFPAKFESSALWIRKVNSKYVLNANSQFLNEESSQHRRLEALSLWFVFRAFGVLRIQSFVRNRFDWSTVLKNALKDHEYCKKDAFEKVFKRISENS